jgi:hypothetical protein
MPYEHECPHCHSTLDPGELCDCLRDASQAPSDDTALVLRPNFSPDAIYPDVDVFNPEDQSERNQQSNQQDALFVCKFCGQTSTTGKCHCKDAVRERNRESVEAIIAQLPMWKERAKNGDDSYKDDELFQFLVFAGKLAAQGIFEKSTIKIDDTHVAVISMKGDYTLNALLKYADEAEVSGIVELREEA